MSTETDPKYVYVTYIAASPEKVWHAITDLELRKRYWKDCVVEIGQAVGEPFNGYYKGEHYDEGEVLVFDPPKKLAVSWRHLKLDERTSRCTWTLEPVGDVTRLTLVHDEMDEGSKLLEGVSIGWPVILAGLKTLVELGDSPFDDWGSAIPEEDYPMEPTIYVTYIETTAEKLWQALTDGEISQQYFFGRRIESDWKVGSPVRYYKADGSPDVSGEILISDYPTLLSYSWRVAGLEHLPDCRVSFAVEQLSGYVRLRMTEYHDHPIPIEYLEGGRKGWPMILSGLKTLLETGHPLPAIAMG